jgi:hypothetical protein
MCGNKLVLIDRLGGDVDWGEYPFLPQKEQDRIDRVMNNDSYWVKCSSCHCFGDDFPLVIHHPLRGLESAPGDSWSLSWVK